MDRKDQDASPPRYCDIVFKGGITSGIVFPDVALTLHREGFHFKSIGGASVGALVAGAVAAAELGERRANRGDRLPGQGYPGLESIANDIAAKGFIAKLFQADPALKPAFGALLEYLDRKGEKDAALAKAKGAPVEKGFFASAIGTVRNAWTVLRVAVASIRPNEAAPLLAPPPAVLLASAVLVGFGLVPAWIAILLGLLSGVVLVACAGLLVRRAGATLATVLQRNNFGLCSGLTMPWRKVPALTDWMHQTFNTLSGNTLPGNTLPGTQEAVLLLKDLWAAPLVEDDEQLAAPGQVIALTTTTTDLSHSEPHLLPFVAGSGAFYWKRREFDQLFPAPVVTCMMTVARDQAQKAQGTREAPWIAQDGEDEVFRFPDGGDVPVVVLARMSLSFPMLLSAVPLYEAVWPSAAERQAVADAQEPATLQSAGRLSAAPIDGSAAPTFRRCWFSDGGICDNFPIDMFDAALPRWPTFGVNLFYPETPGAKPEIRMPRANEDWGRSVNDIDGGAGFGALQRFLWAILDSARNWHYLLQSRAPGTRDRIVHLSMMQNEGGMNFDMPAKVTRALRARGAEAGAKLARDFDMNAHYWTRFRVVSDALARHLGELTGRLASAPLATSQGYDVAYRCATGEEPSNTTDLPYKYDGPHCDGIQAIITAAAEVLKAPKPCPDFAQESLVAHTPKPLQSLKLRGKR